MNCKKSEFYILFSFTFLDWSLSSNSQKLKKIWLEYCGPYSKMIKLIDSLATGEGKEIEKSKFRVNVSLVTLHCRTEITVGTATTELASLNAM